LRLTSGALEDRIRIWHQHNAHESGANHPKGRHIE
jgi:hypothetical protein